MKQAQLFAPYRQLLYLALPLLLWAGTHRATASELPDAPLPQSPAQTIPASVTGTITDADGASIPNARITLTGEGQPPLTATTPSDGTFTFDRLPPGPFRLSIAAAGFSPQQTSIVLQPGETRELPDFTLTAASTTDIEVTATQTEIAQAQINQEEKQRVLGIIPNFYVVYEPHPVPLNPKQKSELAFRSIVDPVTFALVGVVAGIEQASDTYAWEQGAGGYAKRYAANYGTSLTDDILGNAVFPILFHQDPRYFYKGTGSKTSRALYAVSRTFVTRGDNGQQEINYSRLLGGFASGALSNAYHVGQDRGVGLTIRNASIGIGGNAADNLLREFLFKRLTKVPNYDDVNP
jgi:Carboxypeptidase regulatory-like domain